MSGSKIRNIVILLLLTVDLVLLGIFGWRQLSAAQMERQAVKDAAAALERLGMSAPEELLKENGPVLYLMEEERNVSAEQALAELLLGSFSLKSQGGGICTGENSRGRVRLSNAGAFELILYDPGELKNARTAEELFGRFAETAALPVLRENTQFVAGAPVFDRDVTLKETPEGLSVSGGLLAGELYVTDGSPSKSLTAALLALAGERKNDVRGETERVTAAELGYRAELLAENYTALRPVWRITTDRGVYTVDALTLSVEDG